MRVALFGLTAHERAAFAATPVPGLLATTDVPARLSHAMVECAAGPDAVSCGLDEPIDAALIERLADGRIGRLGIDVYEQVGPLYRDEHGPEVIDAAMIARLTQLPHVLLTNHEGYLTRRTLQQIAQATYDALDAVAHGRRPSHTAPLPEPA